MPSVQTRELKHYVLSNFSKKPGCYTTLIEVFLKNKLYYEAKYPVFTGFFTRSVGIMQK